MKLKAIRPHFVAGHVKDVGSVYEVDDSTAKELISTGKAVTVKPGRPAKAKPMTTASASSLIAGAGDEKNA